MLGEPWLLGGGGSPGWVGGKRGVGSPTRRGGPCCHGGGGAPGGPPGGPVQRGGRGPGTCNIETAHCFHNFVITIWRMRPVGWWWLLLFPW